MRLKKLLISFVILLFVLFASIGHSFASNLLEDFFSSLAGDSIYQTDLSSEDTQDAIVDVTETASKPAYFEGDIWFGNSVEIPSKRTINSKTYKNLDGTLTAVIDQDPIHYKDQNGKWQNIDTNIINSDELLFEKAVNKALATVKFSKPSSNADIVTVENGERQISFRPIGHGKNNAVTTVAPNMDNRQFSKNKAKYSNVYEETDFELTVKPEGVKEDIILKKYTGSNVFAFNVKANGMNLSKQPDGSLSFTDKNTGQNLFSMPRPYSYDSGDSLDRGTTSYEFENLGPNNYLIKVIVDDEWLSSSQRIYPVTIDPTTMVYHPSSTYGRDATINQYSPNTNYGDGNLTVGEAAGGTDYRALVRIRGFESIPSNATVINAIWSVNMYAQSSSTNVNLTWNIINDVWGEYAVTWNNQPPTLYGPSYGIAVGSDYGTVGWKNWDITNVFDSWRSGQRTNYGLMLWVNANNYYIYKQFIGSNSDHSNGTRPKLVVTYNEPPSATNTSHVGDTWINSPTPTLNWNFSDPDGDTQTRLHVQVATNTSFSNIVWDSGSINSTNHYRTIPSGFALSTNTRYYWRVKVYDGYAWSNWSSYTSFRFDNVAPTGSIKINNDSTYTTSQNVTLNLSASDSYSGISKMRFQNSGGSWSAWENYAATKSWPLASGDGSKTVNAQFQDNAGNTSTTYSDLIILDTIMPLAVITTPNTTDFYSGIIGIEGSAYDSNFKNWKLEWGAGANPTSWKTIGNFLNNPTMDIDDNEDGIADGWTKSGTGQFLMDDDDIVIGDGNIAQKITDYSGANNYLTRTITGLKPNTDYALSAKVKTYNLQPSTGNGAAIAAYNSQIGWKYSESIAGNVEFADLSVSFNTGSSTSINLYLKQGGEGIATGHVWFDDVQLTESSDSTYFSQTTIPSTEEVMDDFINVFDATGLATGVYTLKLTVTDLANNTSTQYKTFNLDSDKPEAVAVTSPAPENTLSGTVNIQASALDNQSGIEKVVFMANSIIVGEDLTEPYEVSWDTNESINGPHMIRAIAYDKAGNELESNSIEATVENEIITAQKEPLKSLTFIGPFENANEQTRLLEDYLNGESAITPHPGDVTSGKTWTNHSSSSNIIDLNSIFNPNNNDAIYANVYIKSPMPQNVKLHFGSDDAIKAWANGEQVYIVDKQRTFEEDSDQAIAALKEGWNQLLVKLAKKSQGNWRFSVKISDLYDYGIPTLEFGTSDPFKDAIFFDNFNQAANQLSDKWLVAGNAGLSDISRIASLVGLHESETTSFNINTDQAFSSGLALINPGQQNEEILPIYNRSTTASFSSFLPSTYIHQDGEIVHNKISGYSKLDATSGKTHILTSNNMATNSYSVNLDFTYKDQNRDGYVYFRAQDENNGYRLKLGKSGKVAVEKIINSNVSQIGTDIDYTFSTNEPHSIKIKGRGNEFRVSVDGVSILRVIDSQNTFPNAGKAGILADNGTILNIDNFVVWQVSKEDFDNIIVGIATDVVTGQPVSDLPVDLIGDDGGHEGYAELNAITANNGSYAIDLDESLDEESTYIDKAPQQGAYTTSSSGTGSSDGGGYSTLSKAIEASPEPVGFSISADHPGNTLNESIITISAEQQIVTKNLIMGRSGNISGQVTDENSNPIAGIKVIAAPVDGIFSAKSAVTDGGGNYIIEDVNAPYTYNVAADAPNFSAGSVSDIRTQPDQTVISATVTLKPTGAISGNVTDEQGIPIANAAVYAYVPGYEDLKIGALTQSDGSYLIEGLDAPATYEVAATKEAFELYKRSNIQVSAGQVTANINFVLNLEQSYVSGQTFTAGNRNSWGTHEVITDLAVRVIKHDQGASSGIYKWLTSANPQNSNRAWWYTLQYGNWYADWGVLMGKNLMYRANHAHDPDTHASWSGHTENSAQEVAHHYTGVAANKKKTSKFDEIFFLGAALHFVQDARVPQHTDSGLASATLTIMDWPRPHYIQHQNYERWVDLMFKRGYFVPSGNGKRGIYSFGKKKGHFNWKQARGWVDRGAHTAKKGLTLGDRTYYYVATQPTTMKGLDNFEWKSNGGTYPDDGYYKGTKVGGGAATPSPSDDWWYRTEPLVRSTVRTTAGYIYGYYKGDIKGKKLWLLDYGYIYAPQGMLGWSFE